MFNINQSETSQILIVTNSTQAINNGHYIMISTNSCIPWFIFPNFVRSKNLQILPKKLEILVKITLKNPIWSKTFTLKKFQHVAKMHSQLLITANQIPNT